MRNVSETAVRDVNQSYSSGTQNDVAKTSKKQNYGKTIGNPSLSEEAAKIYDELKEKYSNMDFTLVSRDMVGAAKKMAAGMGNPNKMVVLIDEDKLEKMAADPKFRQEIENKITAAQTQMPKLRELMQKNTAISQVGMQIGKDNRAEFFAVVDKAFKDMNERIAEKREQKKADKKAGEKKKAKAEAEEKMKEKSAERTSQKPSEGEVITANSIEELMQKIDDYMFLRMSDTVRTEQEMSVGQHIDFKG